MAWNLSTGLITQILGGNIASPTHVQASTISFDPGIISTTTVGLFNNLNIGDWILVVGSANNANLYTQVLARTDTTLTIPPLDGVTEAAGGAVTILTLTGGSIRDVFKNSVIHLYSGVRPADADTIEAGVLLAKITTDSLAFVAGQPTNGLDVELVVSNTIPLLSLKRLTDPVTQTRQVWQGLGLSTGTAGWARWYSNSETTGASSTACRMDGVVTTAFGGDVVMANGRDIAIGAPVAVTDVSMILASA